MQNVEHQEMSFKLISLVSFGELWTLVAAAAYLTKWKSLSLLLFLSFLLDSPSSPAVVEFTDTEEREAQ